MELQKTHEKVILSRKHKLLKDLTLRPETKKLEMKIEENLLDISLSNKLWIWPQKHKQWKRTQTNGLQTKKLKNFCTAKGTIHRMKRPPMEWEKILANPISVQFSSVQSLSHVQLFAIPWTAALQASLSFTSSWSLLKLMSIESVMSSNHLILCRPLLLQNT